MPLKLETPSPEGKSGSKMTVLETLASWRGVHVPEMAERLLAMGQEQVKEELAACAEASKARKQ